MKSKQASSTRIIKLMPDYRCYPLWGVSPGDIGNINPSDLPLSKSTIHQLELWAKDYDDTLKMDDPAASGFKNQTQKEEFAAKGHDLAVLLEKELGSSYKVISKF